ncbi:MAG: NAD(P)/FAD-dependent oxidoreductase [Patescibacteria group bacterium]
MKKKEEKIKKQNKSAITNCDVLVIGAGSAGLSSALTAREFGKKVIVIYNDELGGECPNYACLPMKALITCAKAYEFTKNETSLYGVHCSLVQYSFPEIMKYKSAVVDTVTGHGKRLAGLLEKSGVKTVKGFAEFETANIVKVGNQRFWASKIVIATGSIPRIPPIEGIEKIKYLTYKEVTSLKHRPKSVVVVGGGPVGCEIATFFGMLGTKVSVMEVLTQILGREDREISALSQAQMQKSGIDVFTNTKVLSVLQQGKKILLTYQQGQKIRKTILVDQVVISAGTVAQISGLHLEKAKVKIDARGKIVVNDFLQTSVKHIFTAGDASGKMQFTHTAHRDGEVVGRNVCVLKSAMRKIDNRVVPRATFVYPEVASVGITQKEALELGVKVEVKSFPIGALGRAVACGKRSGLLKVVIEKKTGQIMGAQMIGECAGEVIHELALGMHLRAKFADVSSMIHAFPTYSEAIPAVS